MGTKKGASRRKGKTQDDGSRVSDPHRAALDE